MSKEQPQYSLAYVGFANQVTVGSQYMQYWDSNNTRVQCKIEGGFVVLTSGELRIRVPMAQVTYISEKLVTGE